MFFAVSSDMSALGLSASALVARNVDNRRMVPELIAYRRAVGERLAVYWKNRSVSNHPVIREYRRMHEQVGAAQEPAAPEKLITYVRRNRDFSASSAVVDCYNSVSARTLLSIGAHDLDKLVTPVTLRLATPQDVFIPLGQTDNQHVPGEYAYVEPGGRIICRLDVLQCEETKVTQESQNIIFFLQSNRCLPAAVLLKGTWLLSEIINRFCGGAVELVSFFGADPAGMPVSGKGMISFDTFRHLNLQKGTVLQSTTLPGLSALSAVTVRTEEQVEALVPASVLPAQAAGLEVLVVTGLHPLVVGERRFTSYLLALYNETEVAPLQLKATVPDGKRLY